ncbi:hypothetical protein QA600_06095 [Natronococcus sp. A-GB1]|uniref:hypothetical protein n=1 Tax=Natronococcus sp. A-GB1 TaxID=3037648 RepID=UPI00241DBEB9|nr:hypothetical protein [Natronococcus sp. A-GB1]MDG5758909.1 hypothetical protein [Natronococcus sp. A-GB1]
MTGSIALDVQGTGVTGNLSGSEADYQMLFLAALTASWRKLLVFYRLGGVSRALGRTLEYLYESAFGYWWAIRHRRAAGEPTASDLPAIVEIDPTDLRYQSRFGKAHFPTKDGDTERSPVHDEPIVGVIDGRWDRFRTEWTETRIHRSLEARFLEGESWERTAKYRYAACKIENGLEDWRSSTIDELQRRCDDLDTLYESMAEEGYVSQTELLERGDDGIETGSAATKSILGPSSPRRRASESAGTARSFGSAPANIGCRSRSCSTSRRCPSSSFATNAGRRSASASRRRTPSRRFRRSIASSRTTPISAWSRVTFALECRSSTRIGRVSSCHGFVATAIFPRRVTRTQTIW